MDQNSSAFTPPRPDGDDVWIPSVCRVCSNCCGIKVHRRNGVIVKIEGNPESPHNSGKMCAKGMANIMSYYDPARPKVPMVRTNPEKGPGIDPKWREVSWHEALDIVTVKIQAAVKDDPRKLVILRSTGEPDWVGSCIGAFAKAVGTPNLAGGPFFATHVDACYLINGTMHVEIDLPRCRYLMLFGSQRGGVVNHDAMRAAREMADARERGMKLVVMDPICSPIASKADEWVPIRPGTDGALALSMLNVLVNELGIYDREFLRAHTNAAYLIGKDGRYLRDPASGKPLIWDEASERACPFDEPASSALDGNFHFGNQSCRPAFSVLKEHLKHFTPEEAAAVTTVSPERIRRLAKEFGEAASIGSTVVIEGRELPYRPACAFCDSRGLSSHQFGMWAAMNVHMLNLVVGALDVPGGSLSTNILGPGEKPRVEESADGMVMATPGDVRPYPARRSQPPQTVNLRELLPLGRAMGTVMMGLTLVRHPHLLPYQPEVLILNNFNMMMSGADPATLAQAIGKFPFVVFLGDKLCETAELADVLLPLLHPAERLDFPMNSMRGWINGDQWYFTLRQPVLPTESAAKHPAEVYLELAERLGVLDRWIPALNAGLGLKEDLRLETGRRYTTEEMIDRHIRSTLGAEHGLEELREKGVIAFPRTLAERFPRALTKLPRVHVYFEFLPQAGRQFASLAAEAGLPVDTRGFQALPCWYPCAAQEQAPTGYDLSLVNYKLPFHSATMTQDNPWLAELADRHSYAYKFLINTKTAARKGIADGDQIIIQTAAGASAQGIAKTSDCIHPEAIGIASAFGHWGHTRITARHRGAHFNSLVPYKPSQIDFMAGLMDACVRVKVSRVRPAKAKSALAFLRRWSTQKRTISSDLAKRAHVSGRSFGRARLLPILSLFFIFLFAFVSNVQPQDKLEKVTIGIPVHALSQLTSYVGVRFGLFREEGLEVQIVQMQTALMGPALISRQLDYSSAADTMMRAATMGLPVKAIAFGLILPALSLNVRPEIKTVTDLKGKSIAVSSKGATTDIVARDIVRHFGLNPDRDIITMPLGSYTNHLVALRTNAIQGAIFTPPYDVIAEKEGFRVIVWAGDVVKDQLQAGLATSEDKIRTNPGQVKRMVRGFVKSMVYLRKEKRRVVDLIAKEWKIDPDIAEKSYDVMLRALSPNGSAPESAVQNVIQQTLKSAKSQKEVLPSQVANLTFLREAQKELGAQ